MVEEENRAQSTRPTMNEKRNEHIYGLLVVDCAAMRRDNRGGSGTDFTFCPCSCHKWLLQKGFALSRLCGLGGCVEGVLDHLTIQRGRDEVRIRLCV